MTQKTPSVNRGRVKEASEKIAKTRLFLNANVDGRNTIFHGLGAVVLSKLKAVGPQGLPCSGAFRAKVANLPQAVATLRKQGLEIYTQRGAGQIGRYVLVSNVQLGGRHS